MARTRIRLKGFPYTGFHRYSLTICTHAHKQWFTQGAHVDRALLLLRQFTAAFHFSLSAYCFMPDHVHLILCATAADADLRRCVTRWKQRSGFEHRQKTGEYLWQASYFDHVLRDDEATDRAVRYVLENPVRKGLVRVFADYPYCGSDVWSMQELLDLWRTS